MLISIKSIKPNKEIYYRSTNKCEQKIDFSGLIYMCSLLHMIVLSISRQDGHDMWLIHSVLQQIFLYHVNFMDSPLKIIIYSTIKYPYTNNGWCKQFIFKELWIDLPVFKSHFRTRAIYEHNYLKTWQWIQTILLWCHQK